MNEEITNFTVDSELNIQEEITQATALDAVDNIESPSAKTEDIDTVDSLKQTIKELQDELESYKNAAEQQKLIEKQLNEFSELFTKLHKTLLALSMSLFAGILGISSFAAASFDSLAARGVKFAISASVPVVGGSISEAMSSVAGSAMLLKNAVGLGGVVVLFAMFALPLLKMWALSLAFRITAAFTAPVSEKRVSETLRKIGDCIDMLFSSVASMGTIMIIAIASIL